MAPYFFGYKTRVFFSFKNNPKNLDPSEKMYLDIWGRLHSAKGLNKTFAKSVVAMVTDL